MIIELEQIDSKSKDNARLLYELWQLSYAIEADWLEVDYQNFPPLQRMPNSFLSSNNNFYVYQSQSRIIACLEIKVLEDTVRIQSALVHPDYIRQGIGRQLMHFVFERYIDTSTFLIETGAKNKPAIALYKEVGFSIVGVYRTSGILKVKMKKKAP